MKLSRASVASLLAVLGFTVANGYTKLALADDGSSTVTAPAASDPAAAQPERRHHGGHAFHFGICVGENLAKQGVTLPPHVKGQKPVWTDAEKAAFKTALEACKPS